MRTGPDRARSPRLLCRSEAVPYGGIAVDELGLADDLQHAGLADTVGEVDAVAIGDEAMQALQRRLGGTRRRDPTKPNWRIERGLGRLLKSYDMSTRRVRQPPRGPGT